MLLYHTLLFHVARGSGAVLRVAVLRWRLQPPGTFLHPRGRILRTPGGEEPTHLKTPKNSKPEFLFLGFCGYIALR